MNYLRSVLSNNFAEEEDAKYILVSSPRIVKFEILIIDFAIRLLETFGQSILFKRSSLD